VADMIVTGSFAEMQRTTGAGLAKSWLKVEAVILVDVSSSMETADAGDGDRERRVAVARREVAKLQKRMPGKLALVNFNHDASWSPEGRIENPAGSTNVAGALEYVADLLGRGTQGIKVVVVSDGEPDSAEAALEEAAKLAAKGASISTVYVGPDRGLGKGFLTRLAAAGKGEFGEAVLVKALENVIVKLLNG
jgi:Mg-chelatase subunit ChlD